MVTGKDAIGKAMKDGLTDPNWSLALQPVQVEVSRGGDLGYTRGTYVLTATDPASQKAVTEKGRFVTIFRKEAGGSCGLSRIESWSKLTLPSMVPSRLTGSITAWGGGWNALILSEYFPYQGRTYEVFGLGAMLDEATYQTGNGLMILLTLLSMVLVVIMLNRLMWRRLYDVATERYRIDY
jgi:hypothetical protein